MPKDETPIMGILLTAIFLLAGGMYLLLYLAPVIVGLALLCIPVLFIMDFWTDSIRKTSDSDKIEQ